MAILVTGGARSGKSAFAEQLATRLSDSGVYLATCTVWDDEMAERIARHQDDRIDSGFQWETIEEPQHLVEQLKVLAQIAGDRIRQNLKPPVVLVDCLTLWLTNWLMLAEDQMKEQPDLNVSEWLQPQYELLADAVRHYAYPLILVTNEVGDGIVPAYPLGRKFRDEAGRLNQLIASRCDRVFLVTVGIPIELKSQAFKWENL